MLGRTRRLGFAAAAAMVAGLGTAGVAQAIIVQPHPVPTWQTNGRVNAIAVSGTTVYLGGQFTSMRPAGAAAGTGEVARNHVAAVSLTTGNLLPWNPNTNGTVRAIKVAGSAVYLGGAFTQVGGVSHLRIAKVSATGAGAVVATWNAHRQRRGVHDRVGRPARSTSAAASAPSTAAPGPTWRRSRGRTERCCRGTRAPTDRCARSSSPSATRLVVGGTFTHLAGAATTNIGAVDADTGSSLPWQGHINYPVIGARQRRGRRVRGRRGRRRQLRRASTRQRARRCGRAARTATSRRSAWPAASSTWAATSSPTAGRSTASTRARPRSAATSCSRSTRRHGALQAWNPSANSVLGVFALQGVGSNSDMLVGGDFTSTGQKKQQGYAQYTP